MSNFDTNKYRIKAPREYRASTKAYPRVKAMETIGKWLEISNCSIAIQKFDNKNISEDHQKTLIECARLWHKLTKFESEVKLRTRKKLSENSVTSKSSLTVP
jgi:hypothetical protein